MYRIALIHPNVPDVNTMLPPLGILYIAAYLEKNDFEVHCFDEDPYLFDFCKALEPIHPDIIGISFSTMSYKRVKFLIKKLRSSYHNIPLCCGGIHTSALPLETMRELDVDFCVAGEGEQTFLDLCQMLRSGKVDFRDIPGLIFRERGMIIQNLPRALIENLDDMPFPARHLLPFERYLSPPGYIRGLVFKSTMDLMASRGCSSQCGYCGSKIIFGCKPRFRSPENVIKELLELQKQYCFESFGLADDNTAANIGWVEKFCELLIKHKNRKPWFLESRVGNLNEKLIQKLKDSHCIQIEFGIESGSLRILKRMKKGITPSQAINTFDLVKRYKIRRLATFMVGYLDENFEDIRRTFTLARRLNADYTSFFYAIPFPGTDFFNAVKDRIELDYSENWSIRQNITPFNVSTIAPKKLARIRAKVQNAFFFTNYANPNNVRFILQIIHNILRAPAHLIGILRILVARRDIEQFAELLVNEYKQRRARAK